MGDNFKQNQTYKLPVVIENSTLEGKIAIVADKADAKKFPDCTVYLPHEIVYLLKLNDASARKFHKMKRLFGGFLEDPASGESR